VPTGDNQLFLPEKQLQERRVKRGNFLWRKVFSEKQEATMSLWIALLVAPRTPLSMTREQFCALVGDLIGKELVSMPCAILGGNVSVECPLAMANAVFSNGERQDGIEMYYRGEDRISLIKTLAEVPYGQSDLCVWFEGFNGRNPTLSESFNQRGYANADILLYALARPKTLQCYDLIDGEIGEEHMVQVCLRTAGNRGPWDIAGTPLEPLLISHFGFELLVDRSYS
jgi:hypothetical protein